MTAHSKLYRSVSHLSLDHVTAWGGNVVAGKGRWWLSDGTVLLRVSRCDRDRIEKRVLVELAPFRVDNPASERGARKVWDAALAEASAEVGPEPDRTGVLESYAGVRRIVGYDVGEWGLIPLNAHKLRLATYVTLADRLTMSPTRAVLWCGNQACAVLACMRQDAEYRWDDAAEEDAA